MGNTVSAYSDFIRFRIKADNTQSLIMDEEPGGWEDDELQLIRNKDYHGIFTSFTNQLEFYGDSKDYIINAYTLGGLNTNLRLTKEILKNVTNEDGSSDVKWVERYTGIADYNTMEVKGNVLKINFNSNDLAELIKSHEDDEFEMERVDSIDSTPIDKLVLDKIEIKGRSIGGAGEQVVNLEKYAEDVIGKYQLDPSGGVLRIGNTGFVTCRTSIVSQGLSDRFSAVNIFGEFPESNPTTSVAQEAMFFSQTNLVGETVDISVQYYIDVLLRNNYFVGGDANVLCDLVRYSWNGSVFTEVSVVNIFNVYSKSDEHTRVTRAGIQYFKEEFGTALEYNESLCFRYRSSSAGKVNTRFYAHTIKIEGTTFYESSPGLSYMFVHDVYERLMYIITGQKNRFYSKFFGRTGNKYPLVYDNGDTKYEEDGLSENGKVGGGLIGLISGYWVRDFDPQSEKYKSLKISLKNLNESCNVVFNTGLGIETVDFEERLRVEELKYFYRDKVVVRLPLQLSSSTTRRVDDKSFYSGCTFGYSKGGDYENEIGLDEPNTQTSYVTPIRKTKNKYSKLSSERADEYGMELTRRKPQSLFPEEDTSEDDHNWFLDIVRDVTILEEFRQAEWQDRLTKLPTGILSPESFRSMIFTPLRLMFRHGWILRPGLEPYLDEKYKIKYINSVQNSKLSMQFIGEDEYAENSDIAVNELERSRFLPEEIEFEHPVDEDLSDKIFGTTKTLVAGKYEDVPNFYFKFEWTNENGEIERGYLLELKPKGKGKFKMIKANEKI